MAMHSNPNLDAIKRGELSCGGRWKLNSLLDRKKIDSITRVRQGARGLCWNERNGEK